MGINGYAYKFIAAKKILKKLKKIQERALRFIYEDNENT
jgi:hypothetical protein